ncbi:hypothetical protein GCG54_00008640 [Colletotrichum gloeosporioides]|uniref:Copper transport protein n=1 Tax=Colletotrichum gloeosporioides TaxID=474922 RepID=A0A8H4CKD6_COLGL|nr:uncharacterized protein GCG54_00008640 [Colletotrichum gloeosporioides]KAF3805409.1 hypothetical protein GCG54_00008640 [Colletotrichum gloeosporioides]
MMDMNMATTTAMAMATSTSMSDSMSMSMEDMTMTFFESFTSPLYSTSWSPTTKGQYAGTCIFLISLACILRLLLALKPILEERFWRNYPVYESDKALGQHGDVDPGAGVAVVRRDICSRWRGWRAGASAARATYEVIIGGVGYLLMLAIMTMNLGYFLSVLGGIWLGTFLIGGLASSSATIHC